MHPTINPFLDIDQYSYHDQSDKSSVNLIENPTTQDQLQDADTKFNNSKIEPNNFNGILDVDQVLAPKTNDLNFYSFYQPQTLQYDDLLSQTLKNLQDLDIPTVRHLDMSFDINNNFNFQDSNYKMDNYDIVNNSIQYQNSNRNRSHTASENMNFKREHKRQITGTSIFGIDPESLTFSDSTTKFNTTNLNLTRNTSLSGDYSKEMTLDNMNRSRLSIQPLPDLSLEPSLIPKNLSPPRPVTNKNLENNIIESVGYKFPPSTPKIEIPSYQPENVNFNISEKQQIDYYRFKLEYLNKLSRFEKGDKHFETPIIYPEIINISNNEVKSSEYLTYDHSINALNPLFEDNMLYPNDFIHQDNTSDPTPYLQSTSNIHLNMPLPQAPDVVTITPQLGPVDLEDSFISLPYETPSPKKRNNFALPDSASPSPTQRRKLDSPSNIPNNYIFNKSDASSSSPSPKRNLRWRPTIIPKTEFDDSQQLLKKEEKNKKKKLNHTIFESGTFSSETSSNIKLHPEISAMTIKKSSLPQNCIDSYTIGPDINGEFVCTFDHCGKKFKRRYNIRSHVQTHLADRPFICTVCGANFVRQHDLKRHFTIHMEYKHICPCGKKFARSDALIRHQQRNICCGGTDMNNVPDMRTHGKASANTSPIKKINKLSHSKHNSSLNDKQLDFLADDNVNEQNQECEIKMPLPSDLGQMADIYNSDTYSDLYWNDIDGQ